MVVIAKVPCGDIQCVTVNLVGSLTSIVLVKCEVFHGYTRL